MRHSPFVACAFVLLAATAPAAAQNDMGGMDMGGRGSDSSRFVWHWGIHGTALLTRVSPAVGDSAITEAYLTQPTLMGGIATRNGALTLQSTISLEGLTLKRGELGPGTYGEGYIDRRHPHTYLHELVGVARAELPFTSEGSITVGRGFAPFGTDDPMMRPFVRFPVNHHLSQVLERLIVIGALRKGPVTPEVGAFNGNEPLSPKDVGDLDRFGDSWSARLTVRPVPGVELQGSRAYVNSPEEPTGEGHDQRKVSASARYSGDAGGTSYYGMAETSRTTAVGPRGDIYARSSVLLEGSASRSGWMGALRLERSNRSEELREGNFRTPWPPFEDLIIGVTRWHVATLHLQKDVSWRGVSASPYVETSLAHVAPQSELDLFQPEQFYGSDNLLSLSAGFRFALGMQHNRMGRYGVAAAGTAQETATMSHDMHH
jgi:hypothetical protein